ncbi:MAG TPA: outer membrane protein transport protein [Gemmatimonadales bacterium]|nr:outer membrane protein transport protein [Gemmatimonadales bacterium]
MRRHAVACAAVLLAAVILVPSAVAQGFSVYEHDACTMARGTTGVAAPCSGGSAVFFNPAGILGSATTFNLEGNLTLIAPTGNYTDSASRVKTDLVNHTFPVPAGYATYQISPTFAAGVGVYAPYGLTTDWPTTSPGRYLAYKTSIASIYVQPTIAWAPVPQLQIGGGPVYVHSSAQVHRRIDASTTGIPGTPLTLASLGVPTGTDFADADFDVSGNGWGFHVGAIFKATDKLSLGVRYLSQVKINYTGTASFTQVPTGLTLAAGNPFGLPGGTPLDLVLAAAFDPDSVLASRGASTSITMPWQVVAGAAYKVMDNLTVLFDWQHTNWSSFNTLQLSVAANAGTGGQPETIGSLESYGNTDAFRVGLDWQATKTLAVRLGALRHNGASPDQSVTPLLPEGNRVEGTVGVGVKLLPQLRLDLGYQYLQQQDRRGRLIDPPAGTAPTPAMNTGIYSFKANLFSASLALGL